MNRISSIITAALLALLSALPTTAPFAACCMGTTGNVDGSVDGVADISDVFAVVDYLGTSVPLSTCVDENDVNKDGTIDISDLFALIDYLSGAAPLPACPTMTDADGNVYQTVTIGTQVWMAENLKVTTYRNGFAIYNVTDGATWGSFGTGAYCNYNNDVNNVATYGRLYNWYAVTSSYNIAPAGWHVPTDADWQTLADYLGGQAVAGGKLKEAGTTHWISPNTGATNESGFSALPGGYRAGNYLHLGYYAQFWSSTESGSPAAWSWDLRYNGSDLNHGVNAKWGGFSVRCVKD